MLEFIKQIIYEVAGKDKNKITYDTDFIKDLELTSYDIMNIISRDFFLCPRYTFLIAKNTIKRTTSVRYKYRYIIRFHSHCTFPIDLSKVCAAFCSASFLL